VRGVVDQRERRHAARAHAQHLAQKLAAAKGEPRRAERIGELFQVGAPA
jgi:hypothetical protein